MQTIIKDDPILQRVHHEYGKFTMDDKLREAYENRIKRERDYNTLLYNAEQRGIEKGLEKGRDEGVMLTAINMKKNGSGLDFISKVTGLTAEEIEKL